MISVARGVRIMWLIAMIAVLVFWIGSGFDGVPSQRNHDGERHLLATLALIVLTFPLGLMWASVLNVAAYLFDAAGYRAEGSDIFLIPFVWLGFTAVGYIQWFMLLPWLWRRWKARRVRRATPSI